MGIYDSKQELFDAFVANDNIGEAAAMTAKMARQLNQRFRRLEKKGIGLKDSAYRYAQRETGLTNPRFSENANYYANLGGENLAYKFIEIDKKLTSITSSVSGIKKLNKKIVKQTIKGLGKKGIEITDQDAFTDFLKMGNSLLESKFVEHYYIFESWRDFVQEKKITNEQFISSFNKFTSLKHNQAERWEKELNKMARANKKKKRK